MAKRRKEGFGMAYVAVFVSLLVAASYASMSITGNVTGESQLIGANNTGLLFFLVGLWGVFLLKFRN